MRKLSLFLLPFVLFLMALAPGEVAPGFEAKNQDGQIVRLADFKGKFVLVYFYPKDDTPGCTRQACSFRDEHATIKKMNTVILGVSRQNEKSHQEFRAKHKLPFDLLVDVDGALANTFGIGRMPAIGLTLRESVLIGPDGKIVRIYKSVDPVLHVKEVIADIQAASK